MGFSRLALFVAICIPFILHSSCMWSVFNHRFVPRLNYTRIQGRSDNGLLTGRANTDVYTQTYAYDGMPDMCLMKGYFYCVSDNLCHKSKKDARDCLQTYCIEDLTEPRFCSALGCTFNYTARKCSRGPIDGSRRFALNFCGNETVDSENNFYLKDERTGLNCFMRKTGVDNIPEADRNLHQYAVIHEIAVEYWIPILDDGNYEIVLKFSEVANYLYYRVHNGSLNGLTLFTNHNIARGTPEQTAIDLTFQFSVSDDVTKLTFMGASAAIVNHNIKLSIQRYQRPGVTNTGHATINAFLIKKI